MTASLSLVLVTAAIVLATLTALNYGYWQRRKAGHRGADAANEELKEIERKKQAGELDEAQSEGARLRLLQEFAQTRADSASKQAPLSVAFGASIAATVVIAGAVIVGTLTSSGGVARRDMDQSSDSSLSAGAYEASAGGKDADIAKLAAYARRVATADLPMSRSPNQQQALPAVEVMIDRLAKRLESAPDDADGWHMLGWSYFHTNRYQDAVGAYARAVALRGDKASWQSEYGAALVKAADGKVEDKAKAAFGKALELDPADREARLYVALAKAQDNDKTGALEDWIVLLKDNPNIANWSDELRSRILALAKEAGVDVSGRLPEAKDVRASEKSAPARGPNSEDIRAAQNLSDEERKAMIRGMVENLASRLESAPDDADGWIRLIRSRTVLREPDKAKAALLQAMEVFKDRPTIKERIAREADALGVGGD